MLDTPSPICFTGLGRVTGGFVSPHTLHSVSLCESGLGSDVSVDAPSELLLLCGLLSLCSLLCSWSLLVSGLSGTATTT